MIDIIIPVYRDETLTLACINSVLDTRQHNQSKFELIVIDDASPEEQLSAELDRRAQNAEFTLLRNEHNLGFVQTVNRGMRLHSDRDVVLLNSDTEVSGNWLDKLHAAANKGHVSSVTPFSNNATICSYPRFLASNPLPSGESATFLNLCCALANPGEIIEIPTAVGFCMYITRKSLDEVGLFDADTFGRGYGEENDFCCRARQAGFRHVLAADTFVQHEGGVSFADEQQELQSKAGELLNAKHPDYNADIQAFIHADPIKEARQRVHLIRLLHNKKHNILMVYHNRGGGTRRHVDDFGSIFNREANVLTLNGNEAGQLQLNWINPGEMFHLNFSRNDEKQLVHLLQELNVSLIHYHHTMELPEFVLKLPEVLNIPYYFTAHDYYTACLTTSCLDKNGLYCGETDLHCLCRQDEDRAQEWRAYWKPFLQGALQRICPSEDTLQRMKSFFPELDWIHCPHPEELQQPEAQCPILRENQPLRVLVLGALSPFKGADVLEAVAKIAKKQALALEFHLIGYAYRNLLCEPQSKLRVHGAYKDAQLIELINNIEPHLIWFPSLAPETYSYTLSAALQTSYPILASKLGALPERLVERPWTYLADHTQSNKEWIDQLLAIRADFIAQKRPTPLQAVGYQHLYSEFYRKDYFDYPRNKIRLDHPEKIFAILKQQNVDTFKISWRQRLLGWLIYLRQSPLLRPLARLVPPAWQKKVKSWLVKV